MSLYLKHRPQTFDQIQGNGRIVQSLKKMLQNKKTCPHSFLLTGETGTGKTTIGRIIARELGADEIEIKEIDSADFRGIDTVRNIREKSQFYPAKGLVRVWLIDECHKWTNDAQNAILKILEDTPNHIYFILCTTEPQKLLRTIKGRCQQFQMELLSDEDMMSLLLKIIKEEGERLPKNIIKQIVTSADGHSRNAIQILEQVLNVEEGSRMEMAKRTEAMQSEMIELARALVNNKPWGKIKIILKGLKGQDAEGIRRMILGYCQAILLNMENNRAAEIIEEMFEPLYNIGYPGLVYNCYSLSKIKE